MISSSIKVAIPLWMNEGLAEYLAGKWDTKSEMWIRDLAINGGELPHIRMLNGYWAYRGGQSVWRFITEKWGEESIAEILYQIKTTNGIEKGIKEALGVGYKELNEQWHEYLKHQYWPEIALREDLNDVARQLTNHEKWGNTYNVAPSISPNGNQIAILSNKSGTMAYYLISAEDGRVIKKIIQGERSAEYEELHILKPGITWSPNSKKLAFSAKSGKSDALFIYDTESEKSKRFRLGLEGIFRPSWSPKGDKIAFIGNDGKYGDIYLFDIESNQIVNLTSDWYSEDQVSWSPNGDELYFTSDRGDILTTGEIQIPHNYDVDQTDIYSIKIETKEITHLLILLGMKLIQQCLEMESIWRLYLMKVVYQIL